MSTTAPYTPLETLFLFRAIPKYGLDTAAFDQISNLLQNNSYIKAGSTYDAARLASEPLQELFLSLLWEELKAGSDVASRPDGALSPASKKRKLQPPLKPTLEDARLYVDQIESTHNRLQDAYVRAAKAEIDALQDEYDENEADIAELEAAERLEQGRREENAQQLVRANNPSGAGELAVQQGSELANGVVAPPTASPQLIPHAPAPLPPQNLARPDIARVGPLPQQQVTQGDRGPPSTPALGQPPSVPSPRFGQQNPPPVLLGRAQEAPRPLGGTAPVLQPPKGLPAFQPAPLSLPSQTPSPLSQIVPEGLQRPEGVTRSKQSPIPPPVNPQTAAQGQLKWEPLYQPNAAAPRQGTGVASQQPVQGVIQPPQAQPPQRVPQQPIAQPAPRPFQPQSIKPASQQSLISPHTVGQYPPSLQPAPTRPAVEASNPADGKQQLAPNVQPNRTASTAYHGFPQPPRGRSPVALSPNPSSLATAVPRPQPGLVQPPPSRPLPHNLQAPSTYTQIGAVPASPSPAPGLPDGQRGYSSPYQAPRSAILDRVQQRLPSTPTPTPPARITTVPFAPQTPAMVLPHRLVTGSSTKWGSESTPSTPTQGPGASFVNDMPASPAFEPLSPVLQHSAVPKPNAPPILVPPEQKKPLHVPEQPAGTPPKRKAGRPRGSQRAQDTISPPKPATLPLAVLPVSVTPTLSPQPPSQPAPQLASQPASQPVPQPAPQPAAESSSAVEETPQPIDGSDLAKVKDEVTTPRPLTETGDTTADESVTGRRQAPRLAKRKREELSPTPVQTPLGNQPSFSEPALPSQALEPAPLPTEVLWTRAFNKVSGSAMEQIVHHRSANMFAAPIRERDAPGYHKVILQPQDLKTIKAAVNSGNKAAAQGAAALPGGDPNTSSVWLPLTEALMPPKSIINSGQLDRELAHMFSNAVMYNPDPGHGPGPAFLIDADEAEGDGQDGGGQDGALGYKVDEFGVVNDARAMFMEVDKLLSELRSAEVRRTGGGRGGAMTGTSTRQASVAQREASMAGDDGSSHHHHHLDEAEEHTATETETNSGNTAKRRRTARN